MPVGTFYTPKHQRRKKPRSLVRISENWFRGFWREGSKSFPSERLKSPVEVRLPGVFLSTDNPSNQPNAKGNKAAFTRLRSPRPFSHTLSPLLLSPSLPCASPLLTPSIAPPCSPGLAAHLAPIPDSPIRNPQQIAVLIRLPGFLCVPG